MSGISLTASMRSNLLSLQNTQSLMDMTQERLSTGKKVNSAIDNPSSYYTAQSLTNRAGDLEALLDSMGQAVQTIKAANEGIESITSFVEQAKAIANSARDTAVVEEVASNEMAGKGDGTTFMAQNTEISVKIGDKTYSYKVEANINYHASSADDTSHLTTLVGYLNNNATGDNIKQALTDANLTFAVEGKSIVLKAANTAEDVEKTVVSVSGGGLEMSGTINPNARDTYVEQFNSIMTQIDQLASDASYKGVNLLKGEELKVVFNEDRSSFLEVEGDHADASHLGLVEATATIWNDNTGLDGAITSIDGAINKLRDMATKFGNNYSIVQTRQDFTENLINVLEEGADDLTLADMNEESANMLALQTRQQLATNSLSLASQAAQSVLSLF